MRDEVEDERELQALGRGRTGDTRLTSAAKAPGRANNSDSTNSRRPRTCCRSAKTNSVASAPSSGRRESTTTLASTVAVFMFSPDT